MIILNILYTHYIALIQNIISILYVLKEHKKKIMRETYRTNQTFFFPIIIIHQFFR